MSSGWNAEFGSPSSSIDDDEARARLEVIVADRNSPQKHVW
jgi:hypothetical protein